MIKNFSKRLLFFFSVCVIFVFLFYILFSGYRHRVRSVLISPSNGGKPCPHLEEVDSCGDPDFFGWQYGNWSECTTRKAEKCGPGKMTRDITCVRWNGVIVFIFLPYSLYIKPKQVFVTESQLVRCLLSMEFRKRIAAQLKVYFFYFFKSKELIVIIKDAVFLSVLESVTCERYQLLYRIIKAPPYFLDE